MGVHPVHEALSSDPVKRLIESKSRQLCRRPEFRGAELLEVQQELATSVLQRAGLFDPARGCVNTFIATVVDSAAAMMVRARRRLKRAGSLQVQSLEGTVPDGGGEQASLLELLVEPDLLRRQGVDPAAESERRELAADLAGVLAGLGPVHREIAVLLMNDGTEASVARQLGLSRRQVRKGIERIRECLRQAGLAGT